MRVIFECYNEIYFHKTRKQSSYWGLLFYLLIRNLTLKNRMTLESNTLTEWEENSLTNHLQLQFATQSNIDDIMRLRDTAPEWSLRPMSTAEISRAIEEFRVVTLASRVIWCCRIFNNRVERTLEIWSIVAERWLWIGKTLIQIAEDYTNSIRKPIIAVTRNIELSHTLETRWWKNVTKTYPNRVRRSGEGSIIWKYYPNTK